MKGCWEPIVNSDGVTYFMCTCGTLSWDGKKCLKGHPFGYEYTPRKAKKKFSGYSPFRAKTGEFQ